MTERDIDWIEFLKLVSYTTDSLSQELEQQYLENSNKVYEGEDLDYDVNDKGQDCCVNCDLKIYERNMLQPCGDTNLCLFCIEDIQIDISRCPNHDCGKVVTQVLPFRK